ncbi:hypothetical protein ON010_g9030 [Phytophthora cinnamomi]|nr:hypothetical protein ON010_g9030 [Phytophthora cinnamomi]
MSISSPSSPAALYEPNPFLPVDFASGITLDDSAHLIPAPPQRAKQKVRHYQRQRDEKEALTQQLAQLSELLRREQEKQMKAKDERPPAPSAWQTLATCHLESRLASEAQRKWLQAAITGRTEIIDGLKSVVRQHLKIAALVAAQGGSELFLEPTDHLRYSIDMQDIAELYLQTDSVFSSSGLDPTTEDGNFRRTVTRDANGVSIQYVTRQRLLFSYEQTCESMWIFSHLLNRQEDREEYTGVEDRENTLAMKFRLTERLPNGERASLKQRIACRRFNEENRVVIVRKSFLAGEGSCSGMQTDEFGWTVLRPSATGSGTVMEVCLRQVPLHLNSASAVPENVSSQYNELLQRLYQDNLSEATNSAESLLLDDVLTGIRI